MTQLRIATITCFSWYYAANTTAFYRCGLIKNIEHVVSEIKELLIEFVTFMSEVKSE